MAKTDGLAERDPARILYTMTRASDSGFTLLELLLVVALVVGIVATVAPKLTNSDQKLRASLRKMAVLMRELHNRARLTHSTYRLVFDLGQGDKDPAQTFWIERTDKNVVVPSPKML